MLKYYKIINEETKEVIVGLGDNISFYIQNGMNEGEVEKAFNEKWYLKGFAPEKPEKTYSEKRREEYPPIEEQLDMIYWDNVNGTSFWKDKITEIKEKYPKE